MERYCKYKYVTNVDGPDGVVRVLCVWKDEEMQASYVVTNHNWVGVSFRRLTDNKIFVVFGVYLPPRFGERLQSLYQLEALVSRVDGPVLLIGDFNAMLSNCNKSGSAPLAASCIFFSRFIYACRLKEVEDTNKKFTWSNHRQGQDSVQCKLDWCLVNNEWQIAFGGEGSLKVQTSASSDHSVLLYQIRDTIHDYQGKKLFRFFKPWLMSKEGKEVMLDAWRGEVRGCPMMRLLVKQNRLRMALLVWNTNSFGNLSNNIANLQSRLEGCRERVEQGIEGAIDEEHNVRKQLSQALLMEEVMWKQRSRIRWLAKRKITSLECEDTEYVQSGLILEVCTTYFRNILATDEAHDQCSRDYMWEQDSQSFVIARSLGVSIDNIRLMETEDKLVWSEDGKAIFKVGEIVKKCRTQGVKEWWRKKIWLSYALAKSCWHTYIACAGRLPTLDRLQKVGIHLANRSSLCLCAKETNGHVLIKCKVTKEVWRYVVAKFGRVKFPQGEKLSSKDGYKLRFRGIGDGGVGESPSWLSAGACGN
ncbi:hypothetical protein EJ110_NYTH11319 [Nymphaea thermarum]|nr:hypothetical protein EJ110_NYTH11319 [Nymphaea thermarum]